MRHGLPLAGVTPKGVDFQPSLRLSRRVPGESTEVYFDTRQRLIVMPRLVDFTRIVRCVCKVELTRPGECCRVGPWHLMSAVGTQKKPPIDNIQVAISCCDYFPSYSCSHSRLAGSPGPVSLPVSRTWLAVQGRGPHIMREFLQEL